MAKDANGATITQVTIKATADTSSAQKSIKNLADKLKGLKAAVGEGISLPSAKKIEAFGAAVAEFKNVKWTSIANGMNKVAEAMERMAAVTINLSAFRAFSKAASMFGETGTSAKSKSATQTAADAVRQSYALRPMGGAARGTSVAHPYGWMHFQPPATQGTSAVGFARTISNVIEGEWREISKEHNISTPSGGYGRNTQNVNGHFVEGEEESNETTRETISLWKTLGFSAENVADKTAHLADVIGNGLRKGAHNAAVSMGNLIRNMAIAPWKRLASSVGDAVKRLTGFLSALKRIAVYRAIRWALKELTKAFKEGMDNLYQYSLLINGQFAKSMDMLATSALYAKNSLAAMVAPIVNAVAPAIDFLTDCFVDCLNTVNELFAALTGAETWTKAIKYPIEYAEAADDASGSAKKLRATLLGFDEINRLDDNRKGSRGSAEDALDYSKMFEEKTVTNKAKGFVDALKKAFKSANFTDVGKTLGTKLKNGLDKIPWDDIKQSVNSHATMVGTLLNGLVDVPNLGTSIGRSIAEAFNVAVGKMNTFFSVVKWDKVGKFLADGVNGFLKNFEIEGLGKNLALIINNGVQLLGNFLGKVEWKKFGEFIGKGINSFFTEVNLKDLGKTISKGIIGALQFVHTFFNTVDFEKVGKKIASFFNGLDWTNILAGLAGAIFKGVKAAIETLGGMISENPVIGTIAAIAVANKIASAFGLPTVTSIISTGLNNLLTGGATATAGAAAGAAGGAGLLGALGSVMIPVTLAAVAIGAAWTIAKYVKDNDKNLGTKEPYAGALFDMENDFETYLKRMYNLGRGRALDTPLTLKEQIEADSQNINSKVRGMNIAPLDSTPQPNLPTIGITTEGLVNGWANELKDLGLNNFGQVVTATNNTASYTKDIKDNTRKTYDTLKDGFSISTTGSNNLKSGTLLPAHKAYSEGGMPDTGSLFLAGESGVELIYSSSTGTNVANRDQIAESVAMGNEEGNELLRELLSVGRSILAKDTTVVTNITTGQITSALDRQNRRSGRAIVPVGG